ncbi:hypothetical protein Tco_1409701 [Tanacetum coccineum]
MEKPNMKCSQEWRYVLLAIGFSLLFLAPVASKCLASYCSSFTRILFVRVIAITCIFQGSFDHSYSIDYQLVTCWATILKNNKSIHHSVTSNEPPGNQKKNPRHWGQESTEAKDADTTSLPLSKDDGYELLGIAGILFEVNCCLSLVLFCIICSYEINGDDEGCDANDDDSDCGKDTG